MTKEDLPEPRSPLPKAKDENFNTSDWRIMRELHRETVLLRQDLNKVLTYLKSSES